MSASITVGEHGLDVVIRAHCLGTYGIVVRLLEKPLQQQMARQAICSVQCRWPNRQLCRRAICHCYFYFYRQYSSPTRPPLRAPMLCKHHRLVEVYCYMQDSSMAASGSVPQFRRTCIALSRACVGLTIIQFTPNAVGWIIR